MLAASAFGLGIPESAPPPPPTPPAPRFEPATPPLPTLIPPPPIDAPPDPPIDAPPDPPIDAPPDPPIDAPPVPRTPFGEPLEPVTAPPAPARAPKSLEGMALELQPAMVIVSKQALARQARLFIESVMSELALGMPASSGLCRAQLKRKKRMASQWPAPPHFDHGHLRGVDRYRASWLDCRDTLTAQESRCRRFRKRLSFAANYKGHVMLSRQ